MKESEHIKIITDQGHLPPLSDCTNITKTKNHKKLGTPHKSERFNILASRQQSRMDSLNNELKSSQKKLTIKIITVTSTKNDELSQKINHLNIDADNIITITSIKNVFYIWYKE